MPAKRREQQRRVAVVVAVFKRCLLRRGRDVVAEEKPGKALAASAEEQGGKIGVGWRRGWRVSVWLFFEWVPSTYAPVIQQPFHDFLLAAVRRAQQRRVTRVRLLVKGRAVGDQPL